MALATLQAGFTTVMSMGSDADKELRDAIDAGSIPGPRILTSLSPVRDTGLTASQARRLLRRLKASGADFVKIFATNSVMEGGDPLYTRERLAILCRQAKRYGLRSVIHAESDSSLRVASAAGCDRVEHGNLATAEGLGVVARSGLDVGPQCGLVLDNYLENRARVEGMKGFGVGVMSYMEKLRPALPNVIRTALAIPGLNILYGTDATAGAHGKNAEDLVCRVREAGESPMSALVSDTSRNAEAIGLGKKVGTIAPGFEADIIALEGNPLEEIEAVRRVRFVIKGGRAFLRPGAIP